VADLITTDRTAVTGRLLLQVFKGSTDALEAWNEKRVPRGAGCPASELLVALDRWGRRFARLTRTIPAPAFRLRLLSAWGASLWR
jgi:hypothetical protein